MSINAGHASDPMEFALSLMIPTPRGDYPAREIWADFQRERFAALAVDLLALQLKREPTYKQHWWEATKGASKDSDLAIAVLWLLAFSSRPLRGMVGAADQDQAAEMRLAAGSLLNANPWLSERIKIDKWKLLCEASGASVEIIAADVAGSHGSRPDFLVLNELHAITEGKKEFALNMLDNASKVPWGIRLIATNAGFTGTWQWTWRERARTSDRWYFHRWAEPAPWLTPEDLEEARARNSNTRYLRLWQGVWVPATGDALDQADIEAAVTMPGPHLGPIDGYLYAAGLDLGVKRDHSALVIVGTKPGSGRVAVAASRSWTPIGGKVDLIEVRDAVLEAARVFSLGAVAYDPFQAELMAQELTAAGIPTMEQKFVGGNLDMMASTLMQAFRGRTIDLYPDPELVADLRRLTIEERRFGHKLVSASDEQGHADRAIALSIILPAMLEVANSEPPDDAGDLPGRVVA
jgi:hypothetical protein